MLCVFCCRQVDLVIASDPPGKSDDSVVSWSGPSSQNDANAYIQAVQNFWTDDRLAGAAPKPMPPGANNENSDKFFGSGGEFKK
ncbi:unnamed protein product [Rotaria socialis]|uniref:Uncharacterized protein n=1 Tax=Rotaria socialis TaxID=392032 RepID=A0A818FJZ7_9BILA|nr:unnamed protein product [Rotaria socialis]CAF3474630.1 unnamed protein product [Rotaria socialis]CAF4514403.1 unnamed protein product [Rotaria socialis]CAF4878112.1 unnamed protein product [Rotaria socialis]